MKFNIDDLTLDELIGQVICPFVSPEKDIEEIEKMIIEKKPGGLFFSNKSAHMIEKCVEIANKHLKLPPIICGDVEFGPGSVMDGAGAIPKAMAIGAADSVELAEESSAITAAIARKNGFHWTFSPVCDLSLNFRSSETSVRAVSDSPEHVIKITGAQIRGFQKNGLMAATAKHFPGQGIDERNSHFCTITNDLSREEWMNTFGRIYKELIRQGVSSIMIGHSALPFCEKDVDEYLGCPPAVISKSIINDLLKEELGFEGCVVSDALSMVGACAMCPIEELAPRFLAAGGDMVLGSEKNDIQNITNAVNNGMLSIERLKDAVKRIVKLKESVRLFEDQQKIIDEIEIKRPLSVVAQEIADRSIVIERDFESILPLNLKPNSKILFVNVVDLRYGANPTGKEADAMKSEFEKQGHTVDVLTTPQHYELEKIVENYDAVLVNYFLDVMNYHGGTMRVGWKNIFHLWRGYIFRAKNLIFTSFGDPYKLYDIPFAKEYINAFSDTDESQRAVAKVIMGIIEANGKNPIQHEGYFKRDV